jgi:hypothetical protein
MSFLTKWYHAFIEARRRAQDAVRLYMGLGPRYAPIQRPELTSRDKARKTLARLRTIESLPDHIDHVVRIEGNVRPDGETLRTPFRKRRCVYYEITIERRQADDRGKTWIEVLHDKQAVDFFLEGPLGNVRVSTADFELDADFPLMEDTAIEGIEEALEERGVSYKSWRFHGAIRLRERYVALNQRVDVCGRLQWEFDPAPKQSGGNYRETPKRPVIVPGPEGFVLALEM